MSFDIVSLYTMIPIYEAIDAIKDIIYFDTTLLVRTCLKFTYLSYHGNIYKEIHGVAMGSPLSPIITNIYMKNFEMKAINFFLITIDEWKRYVNDIFAKWHHGIEKLHEFLAHLNSLSQHIQFTIEIENNGKLPF